MFDMNSIKKCPECGNKDLLLTQHMNGRLLCVNCIKCGWTKESDEFKILAAEIDDIINNFDRKGILLTKEKMV